MNQMMMQMMQAFQQMQQQVGEAQAKLAAMSVTEEGGDGLVRVTASGEGKITKLELDQERMKGEEKEVLEDLIMSTINRAIASVDGMKERELGSATQGMMPNIPGLNQLFGG